MLGDIRHNLLVPTIYCKTAVQPYVWRASQMLGRGHRFNLEFPLRIE